MRENRREKEREKEREKRREKVVVRESSKTTLELNKGGRTTISLSHTHTLPLHSSITQWR